MSIFSPRAAGQLLIDWAAGNDCALCASPVRHGVVCAACTADLPRDPPSVPGLSVAFAYRFPVDRLVQRFKHGDLALGAWLAQQLARAVAAAPRPDALVAVPMSAARLRARRFDQAMLLARRVGAELGLRCMAGAVRKIRDTPPQQGLGRRARAANLRGAFACDGALAAARVAIVDDVVTTGATARAVAQALRRAGVRDVQVWAIARASARRVR